MEFKGTKGEWKVVNDFRKPIVMTSISKYEICLINEVWTDYEDNEGVKHSKGQSHNEMMATAKLIAASPDLLKALQSLKAQFKEMILDEGIDVDEGDTQVFNQATKAINKALN
jgi:hypothetical protein